MSIDAGEDEQYKRRHDTQAADDAHGDEESQRDGAQLGADDRAVLGHLASCGTGAWLGRGEG